MSHDWFHFSAIYCAPHSLTCLRVIVAVSLFDNTLTGHLPTEIGLLTNVGESMSFRLPSCAFLYLTQHRVNQLPSTYIIMIGRARFLPKLDSWQTWVSQLSDNIHLLVFQDDDYSLTMSWTTHLLQKSYSFLALQWKGQFHLRLATSLFWSTSGLTTCHWQAPFHRSLDCCQI